MEFQLEDLIINSISSLKTTTPGRPEEEIYSKWLILSCVLCTESNSRIQFQTCLIKRIVDSHIMSAVSGITEQPVGITQDFCEWDREREDR